MELVPGMVFTIEPILVEGDRKIQIWEDNWTAATVDGGRYIDPECIDKRSNASDIRIFIGLHNLSMKY